jgi:peptidoglycan glycosyltransferase
MASSPGYDPNSLKSTAAAAKIKSDPSGRLINRATQFGYAPGSTFKVVTATAAIDSGAFSPSSTVSGRNDVPISGVPLQNDQNESLGQISLTEALAKSVNTVWAQVAEKLGHDRIADYMRRFGFDKDPPMDYPDGQMRPSGVFDIRRQQLIPASSRRVDIGRVGIGQERLLVTPLQMATVAATIANGGMRMNPHLADRIVDQDGRTVRRIAPEQAERVMSAASAQSLAQMMSKVVTEGTGIAAALQGIQVAGKTGTAELNIAQQINQPWFIGFAPLRKPRIAVAVTIENVRGPQSQGGIVAAPIAKQVLQELLR